MKNKMSIVDFKVKSFATALDKNDHKKIVGGIGAKGSNMTKAGHNGCQSSDPATLCCPTR